MVNSESYNMNLVNIGTETNNIIYFQIGIIFFLIIGNNKSKHYICCNTKRY